MDAIPPVTIARSLDAVRSRHANNRTRRARPVSGPELCGSAGITSLSYGV